ncbi:MAG: sulfurtransferase TusA family protein [Eggerthellaceae bacterium]|nr:sulfurtransferase TusA family protein [Eggerthellaceae bacterium]
MVTVDAKGLSCPEPVMLAKKAVKKNPSDDVQIVVDNATARDNIIRMARGIKRTTDVRDIDGVYTLTLKA